MEILEKIIRKDIKLIRTIFIPHSLSSGNAKFLVGNNETKSKIKETETEKMRDKDNEVITHSLSSGNAKFLVGNEQ